MDRDGTAVNIAATPEAYISTADVSRRVNAAPAAQQRGWQEHRINLIQDPRVLRYYDFEGQQPWERVLQNRAASATPEGQAMIVGCQWVQGMWSGKGALDFRRIGDRVRLTVPDELESFTLAASVRIDSLENRYNGIFMSDDFGVGAIHWQFARDGTITLGVQGAGEKGGINYTTPSILGPNELGQWVNLAVVVDAAKKTVSHYVDGQPVSIKPLIHNVKIHIGAAQLGNWGHSTQWKSVPVRNFSGRISEFVIFNAPLSPEEIQALARLDNRKSE